MINNSHRAATRTEPPRSRQRSTPRGIDAAPYRGWLISPHRLRDLAGRYATPWDQNADAGATSATETANVLRAWQRGSVLLHEKNPVFYAYQQSGPRGFQRGLLAAIHLDSRLLAHEELIPARCEGIGEVVEAGQMNLDPVLLGHSGGDRTAARLEDATELPPTAEVLASDGQRHQLWRIDDRDSHVEIRRELGNIPAFIADGHHRYIAARQYRLRRHAAGDGPGPWDRLSALLVDVRRNPLKLAPVHRVLPQLEPTWALAAAATRFRVLRLRGDLREWIRVLKRHSGADPTFVVVTPDGAYLLIEPDRQFLADELRALPPPIRHLHVTALHTAVIGSLWDVPELPGQIQFEESAARASQRVREHGGVAVLLNPPGQADLRRAAAAGVRLPRKALSFVPKPHPGLVLRSWA